MTENQSGLASGLVGLLIGLAGISCGVYLALRHPERLKNDSFAKWLGLHRAPRSYWRQCVAAGVFFISCGVMVLASSGDPEREAEGWRAAAITGSLAMAAVSVIAGIIFQTRDSKKRSDDGEGEA